VAAEIRRRSGGTIASSFKEKAGRIAQPLIFAISKLERVAGTDLHDPRLTLDLGEVGPVTRGG
jgi:hypothetical protein